MSWRSGSPPETTGWPWYAKAAAGAVAAYALSPIDLIPDFVPVLGYLDDLLIVPLGILLAIKLVPADLMMEFRAEAIAREGRPVSKVAAAAIITLWLLAAAFLIWLFWPRIRVKEPALNRVSVPPVA